MKTHVAILSALIAGVAAIGSATALADDECDGKGSDFDDTGAARERALFSGHTRGKDCLRVG